MSQSEAPAIPDPPSPAAPSQRLASIDAYRGLVMLLMLGEVLHFGAMARNFPESPVWKFLALHQSHVEWIGCTIHDLIQPSFSFLVGTALAFSIASRRARGQSPLRLTLHAAWRALVLVALGIFLRSMGSKQTNYTFEDTLTQIGLGYLFLYVLAWFTARTQVIALAVILIGYWAAFALYPLPEPGFDLKAVGVPRGWPHLMNGFAAHWNKNTNLAWSFDTWFLNLFPRSSPFEANRGGYSTLSFIPTLGTMILGLLAGGLLRAEQSTTARAARLFVIGGLLLAAGWMLGETGACPVVKRIWTPSWVLFSGGWCYIILAVFHALVDGLGLRRLVFPLIVVGMNSITAYLIAHTIEGFLGNSLKIHLGPDVFKGFGPDYEPVVQGAAVLLLMWLILFWMYRRKIFLRI